MRIVVEGKRGEYFVKREEEGLGPLWLQRNESGDVWLFNGEPTAFEKSSEALNAAAALMDALEKVSPPSRAATQAAIDFCLR